MTRFARGRCVLVAGLCFAACGCGSNSESGPKLTGRVLVDGKACRPASLFEFDVKFIADQGDSPIKKSYLAVVQEDGTFTVHGSTGKGIPPGKYRVSISGPILDSAGKTSRKYMAAYTDKTIPLEIQITDNSKDVVIDLERKTAEVS